MSIGKQRLVILINLVDFSELHSPKRRCYRGWSFFRATALSEQHFQKVFADAYFPQWSYRKSHLAARKHTCSIKAFLFLLMTNKSVFKPSILGKFAFHFLLPFFAFSLCFDSLLPFFAFIQINSVRTTSLVVGADIRIVGTPSWHHQSERLFVAEVLLPNLFWSSKVGRSADYKF